MSWPFRLWFPCLAALLLAARFSVPAFADTPPAAPAYAQIPVRTLSSGQLRVLWRIDLPDLEVPEGADDALLVACGGRRIALAHGASLQTYTLDGQRVWTLDNLRGKATHLAVAPDGKTVAVTLAGRNEVLLVRPSETSDRPSVRRLRIESAGPLLFGSGGELLVGTDALQWVRVSENGQMQTNALLDSRERAALRGRRFRLQAIDLIAHGRVLVVRAEDASGVSTTWRKDLASGRVTRLEAATGGDRRVLGREGRFALAGAEATGMAVIDTDAAEPAAIVTTPMIMPACIDAAKDVLAFAWSEAGPGELAPRWRLDVVDTGRQKAWRFDLADARVRSVRFTSSGDLLLLSGAGNDLQMTAISPP